MITLGRWNQRLASLFVPSLVALAWVIQTLLLLVLLDAQWKVQAWTSYAVAVPFCSKLSSGSSQPIY